MPPKTDLKALLPERLLRGQSAARFFSRYEAVCTCMDWTDDKKRAAQVIVLFGDEIFDFADSLPEATKSSYNLLKTEIINEVDGGELKESYVRQFQTITFRSGEDISAFMTKMKRLAKKAYPDLDDTVLEPLIMQQFVMAMPSEVRRMVYLSTTKATSCATQLEECKKYLQVIAPSDRAVCAPVGLAEDKLDTVLRKVESLSLEVASLKSASGEPQPLVGAVGGQSRSRSFTGNCYNCGQPGHISRYCKSPRKDVASCSKCGNAGHFASQCALSRGTGCRKCGNVGHNEKSCQYKGLSLNWS